MGGFKSASSFPGFMKATMKHQLIPLLVSFIPFILADLPSISHVRVPKDPFEPVQIRQAYAGPTGMHLSWNTFSKLPAPPTVNYGLTLTSLPFVSSPQNAESVTYPTSLTYNNHVHIKYLTPNTKYFWKPAFSNATSIFSFTTAREAGDHTLFTIAVVVDLGLIGPQGMSTTVGAGASNPLKPGEINTIQSLQQHESWDFLWHREFNLLEYLFNRSYSSTRLSGRHCVRRLLAQRRTSRFLTQYLYRRRLPCLRIPPQPIL